jgi:hypothetical protein
MAGHLCINCNSEKVSRTGDEFICGRCGYHWDVAHEQANAVYLASQGRVPAQSRSAQDTVETPEQSLLAKLGIAPDLDEKWDVGRPDEAIPLPEMPVDLYADDSVELAVEEIEEPADDVITLELREPAPPSYETLKAALEKKTVPELEALADEAGIDLSDAKLKADKVERLAESDLIGIDNDEIVVIENGD